jgi:protein-S-isoprenylcysteine O-methyltransferase Ste14
MLLRALFAFLALPGVVAFAVPFALAVWANPSASVHIIGLVPLCGGTLLLLSCVREFYVAGRGTLAPWAPPKHLVVSGPYRYCRNPMYVGVAVILLGWAVLYWSWTLLLYSACVAAAFHLRVVFVEEPWAARTFGDRWSAYRAHAPRWFF